jgi:uncharacterized protein YgiM (DUF1202 family)
VVFEYTATSPYELSIDEGETVKVLEEDDGSGWVKVANDSGGKGLVPASYVEVIEGRETKPSVTPRTSAQYGASIRLRRFLLRRGPFSHSFATNCLPPPITVIHGTLSQFAGRTIIGRRVKTRSTSRRGA